MGTDDRQLPKLRGGGTRDLAGEGREELVGFIFDGEAKITWRVRALPPLKITGKGLVQRYWDRSPLTVISAPITVVVLLMASF